MEPKSKDEKFFFIPLGARKCHMNKTIPEDCPYSFEHTRMLLLNGCTQPANPMEYFGPVCQNCVNVAEKALKIRVTVAQVLNSQVQEQEIPAADTTGEAANQMVT